jgi:hypothetical protein
VSVSAQELMRTRDCKAYGCANDAGASGYCGEHQTFAPRCKIDGCAHPANDRYDRGILSGLCEEHMEQRRRQASDEARATHAARETGRDDLVLVARPHTEPATTTTPTAEGGWTRKKKTKDEVLDALRKWIVAHDGEPPALSDWRGTGGEWPSPQTVERLFGTWAGMFAAAGLKPRAQGGGHRKTAAKSAPDPQPEPEPATEAEPEAVVEEPDFTAVAVELQAARDEYDAADTRLSAAMRAFTSHPFLREMDDQFGLLDDLVDPQKGAAAA